MNNGRINQIRGATRDIPQVFGEGICAHKTNGGKLLKVAGGRWVLKNRGERI